MKKLSKKKKKKKSVKKLADHQNELTKREQERKTCNENASEEKICTLIDHLIKYKGNINTLQRICLFI